MLGRWKLNFLFQLKTHSMFISHLKRFILIAICSGMTATVFAEDAPVYDVDSYPPQFDGQAAKSQTLPQQPSMQQQPMQQPQAAPPVDSNQQALAPLPSTQSLTVEQRISRLEQQNANVVSSDLSSKMNDLQTQVQTMHGQIEDLTHQLQQLQTQQKTLYSDLDKRVANHANTPATAETDPGIADTGTDTATPKAKKSKSKLAIAAPAVAGDDEAAVASPAADQAAASDLAAAAPKTDDQPNVAEEQQIYQTAYGLIKAKKYNDAATTLQKMLRKYPSGQFAANAHYWLGELYGLMGKNDQAVIEFGNVVKNYPDSPKLADAQLKLGLIYAAQLKWSDAKSAFKKVINHYPGTSSAHLAAEQLKQIKQAGH
jgi:tol-pal system protein YbgF